MSNYYTGVGSRQCPDDVCDLMTEIAKLLHERDFILRSGGANGADKAFENGSPFKKEIYLPWKKFNDNHSPLFKPSDRAIKLASEVHPAWDKLSYGAKLLHARNCHQVLGRDLNTPSDFLICWTLDGKVGGGTRTAIVLAQNNDVPVYNLADDEWKGFDAEDIVSEILE